MVAFGSALANCKSAQCPAQAADPRNLCSHGIPNLATVDKPEPSRRAVYRGGQPTAEGWAYLHDTMGVQTVVKLNDASESWEQGEDEPARRLGMTVVNASMPPHDHGLAPASLLELFKDIPEDTLALAVATVAREHQGNVYVHCSHGRDRTGLVVGLYRVLIQKQDPRSAHQEMNQEGFRPLNLNLSEYWHSLFDEPNDDESKARRARLVDSVEKRLAAR